MQINSNLSIETTRKKALEIMQKGMIAYKLANLGWDVKGDVVKAPVKTGMK